jgi:hypothetical protein
MNNKGQGMSTNTIVILILAVVVLVVLILGFTMGWNKLAPWISSSNVDNIVNSCSAACSTNALYDFCSYERELKDAEGNSIKTTCAVFAEIPEYFKYGIESCRLDCNKKCEEIKIDGTAGEIATSVGENQIDVSSLASGLVEGQYCVI